MPSRLIELPWDSQPQEAAQASVDWPLAGLYSPLGYNAVSGGAAATITAPRVATRFGLGLSFAGGSETAQFDRLQVSPVEWSSVTLLIPAFSSSSNTRQGIWHFQETPGSVGSRLRLIWLNAAEGFYADTNAGYAFRCIPSFAAGDPLVIGITKRPGATNGQFYINGQAISTVSRAAGGDFGTPSTPAPLWLGHDIENSARRLNGSIAGHSHFRQPLSADRHAEIAANPWQLFAPRRIFIPVAAAGGSASTITPATGTSTTSALTGRSTAAAAITPAAGISTASTLTGSSTVAATITPAAGVSTAGTLAGTAGTGATITPAAGASTTSTLTGGATAAAAITPAAGTSTASTLTGRSTAAATITAAAGQSTTGTLVPAIAGQSTITPAAGISTTSTLAGRSTARATIAPVAGTSTAGTLVGGNATPPVAEDFSVTLKPPAQGINVFGLISPVTSYDSASILLPPGVDRQEVIVHCRQSVGVLTLQPVAGQYVSGAPASLAAPGFFRLRFDGLYNLWCRIG